MAQHRYERILGTYDPSAFHTIIPPPINLSVSHLHHTTIENFECCMYDFVEELLGHYVALKLLLAEEVEKTGHYVREQAMLLAQLDKEMKEKQELEKRLHLLTSNMERLADDAVQSGDMKFGLVEGEVSAHSCIVGLWSLPFKTMLGSGMQEGITKSIAITTEEPEHVQSMIRYFYTARANINRDSALPLLQLSDMYEIDSLRDTCIDYFMNNMDYVHCVPLYQMACLKLEFIVTEKWERIYELCCAKFRENEAKAQVLADPSVFQGLHFSDMIEILHEMFIKWGDVIPHAVNLGRALASWGKANWGRQDLCEMYLYTRIACCFLAANDEDNTTYDHIFNNSFTLGRFCMCSITLDFVEQSKCAGFLKLPIGVLQSIFNDGNLNVKAEIEVLQPVAEWLNSNPCDDKKTADLISLVRFPFVELKHLMDIPRLYPVIASCSKFKTLLHEALLFQLNESNNRKRKRAEEMDDDEETRPKDDEAKKLRCTRRESYETIPTTDAEDIISCLVSTVGGTN